jgi:hypothetical protein
VKIDPTVIGACGHHQEDHAPYAVNRLDEAGAAAVEAKAAGCGACINDFRGDGDRRADRRVHCYFLNEMVSPRTTTSTPAASPSWSPGPGDMVLTDTHSQSADEMDRYPAEELR